MLKNHQDHERQIFSRFLTVFLAGGVLVFLIKNELIPGVSLMTNQNKNLLFLVAIFLWLGLSFYFGKALRRRDHPYCPCSKCNKKRLMKKEIADVSTKKL